MINKTQLYVSQSVMGGTHKNFQLSSAFGCNHACRLLIREHKALIGPQKGDVNA